VITNFLQSANSIFEGDILTLSGQFLDPGSLSSHTITVSWGDGTATTVQPLPVGSRSFFISHTYLDDNPTGTPIDLNAITLTLTDNNGLAATINSSVFVNNLNPVITSFTAGAPSGDKAVEGMPISLSASFSDLGILDTHTAVVDWGDGTNSVPFGIEINGSGSFFANHTYAFGGIFNVTITIRDDDTGIAQATDTVFITGAGIHLVNGKLVLQVVGTNGDDNVIIDEPGSGFINVYGGFLPEFNHRRVFGRTGVDYVEVVLCGGHDHGTVSGWVTVPSIMDGGEGNDILTGGRGGIVLIGGPGNDWLAGSTQRSILIGSDGEDDLIGRADDDILIGGRTSVDSGIDENKLANDAALIRLLAVWKGPGTAAARKAQLEAGVDGFFLRLGETVFDDGNQRDRLTGSLGADWFFQFGVDQVRDFNAVDFVVSGPPTLTAAPAGLGNRIRPAARAVFLSVS
jgi:Ca2+-binding RTX toxin-like protein